MSLAQFCRKGRMPAGYSSRGEKAKYIQETSNETESPSYLNSSETFYIDRHVHSIFSNTSQNYRKYFLTIATLRCDRIIFFVKISIFKTEVYEVYELS